MDFGGLGDNGKALEASFKEFLNRPENRSVVEKHQRKEVKQAIKLQERMRMLDLKDKVLESELEAQKNIAPFLRNRVLCRIVQTFANDPQGDFSKWACNPHVIGMLREAQRLMDEGFISEAEMEASLIRQLQDPGHEAHEEFARKTKQVVRLPTDQLVGALNEHLAERRQGNAAYKSRDFAKARHHYERARSVVEFVQGLSSADQAEVDANRLTTHLNLAALHLATQEYGTAVEFCDLALALDPRCAKALARRCRAHTGRHEYQAAEADLAALRQLDPGSAELAELKAGLSRARESDKRTERQAFGKMFGSVRQPASAAAGGT